MSTLDETRPRLVQLDEQLIKVLADRAKHCDSLRSSGDPVTSGEEAELIENMVELGVEFGLEDDEQVEELAQIVIEMGRE